MIRYISLLSVLVAHSVSTNPEAQIQGYIDESVYSVVHHAATSQGIKSLTIYIDSPGGSTTVQSKIIGDINVLRAAGIPVTCIVTGRAMSAAFVILESCTTRIGRPGSEYLIHEPRAVVSGILTIRDALGVAKDLIDDLNAMLTIVAPRIGMTPEQLGEIIDDAEIRWTARECLEHHGLDDIQM